MRGACTTVSKILRLKGEDYLHDAIKVLASDVWELEGLVDRHDIDIDTSTNYKIKNEEKIDKLSDRIEVLEESIANLTNRMDKQL